MKLHNSIVALISLTAACGPKTAPVATPAPSSPAAAAPAARAAAPAPDPLIADLNLDFEAAGDNGPDKWYAGGAGYEASLDGADPHSGARSLRIAAVAPKQFGVATARFPVERARGKQLELTGYVKTADVKGGWAGLWMRVNGADKKVLAFDNMQTRGITGTTPWTRYSIVLGVPPDATGIYFGGLLAGNGTMWLDTLRFKVIDAAYDAPVEIDGTVVDTAGKPVPGALVALVSKFGAEPVGTAVTDTGGRFHIAAPPGMYGITSTAPGLRGGYVAGRTFNRSNSAPVRLVMGGDAFTHSGKLVDETGAPIGDAMVAMVRRSEETGDIWYTRTAKNGSFSLTLMPADEYSAFVLSDAAFADEATIPGRASQSTELHAQRVAPAPDAVVQWIGKSAVPLTTVEAGHGFSDMKRLRKIIGNARVVGLGEATHGTREFFQMKHRMLEFLVEKMGFTVFAIEANFPESQAIDDYVLHGTGDPKEALAGIYFWTWRTEEVLDLIEWMRAYNADAKHKRKLRFYGVNMQTGRVATQQLHDYLQTVNPAYTAGVNDELKKMTDEAYLHANAASLGPIIDSLGKRLDDRRSSYVKKSSRRKWQIARQNARILAQQRAMNSSTQGGFGERDAAMAANVEWISTVEPKGTRIVLWAHNGHISKQGYAGVASMGAHLAKDLGNRYVNFGFVFDHGGFQAMHGGANVEALEVGPPPVNTLGATFTRAGCSICVLDLRRIPAHSPAAAWFGRPRRMRAIGAVYTSENDMLSAFDFPASFDALIFVRQTTRARPLR